MQRLLRELQNSLSEALVESSALGRALKRIRREGWTVYLVVDRTSDEEVHEALELTGGAEQPSEAVFKIDGQDLAFLQSVGIDPTRKLRRRRDR